MTEFLTESTFVTAVMAWFVAQVLKVILVLVTENKFDMERFIGSGGMPSSHSAFVTSLATEVGLTAGFTSELFAVAAVLAMVVMYDATGVRRAAGEQAKLLNNIIEKWGKKEFPNVELKELLGHTPVQVFAGAMLGILVAVLRHLM
ncbi:MAG: divergent PAP2 family protein [Clostridia bacterium]|nr:divergent PAP2 family protein [Clostridia bacterium]